MEIELDLKRHCIQTEIRRQYNMLISDYFKADPQGRKSLEGRIDLLHNALESLDFGWLRATYPALSGGKDDRVTIESGPDGRPAIRINGNKINEIR